MAKLGTWCVYLDVTHLEPDSLEHEFPTIWERLREVGIEIEKDWIPVVPAQHYSCGGVETDLVGRTSVPGLYAAGEVSSTGVHGANRLASNSLLEAMVFSISAAEHVPAEPEQTGDPAPSEAPKSVAESEAVRIRHEVQRSMSQHCGVFRTNSGLAEAMEAVSRLEREYESAPEAAFSAYSLETRNVLIAASHVIKGAGQREHNVGLHYNADLSPLNNGAAAQAPAKGSPTRAT
jgi:L-aspartate oxidase